MPEATLQLPSSIALSKTAISTNHLVQKELEERIKQAETGVLCALNMMLDLKDLRTGLHATRLAEWAVRVGERMGLGRDELRDIERASLLHDIGKIGVPDEILFKPGKLDEEETEQARRHPEYGWAILHTIPGFERTSLLVLHHHERFDGAGYPAGLKGSEIPLGSRIVAVVDAYDAMISDRAYRQGLPHDEAVKRLVAEAGCQFDPDVTELFVEMTSRVQQIGSKTPSGSYDDEIPSFTLPLVSSQR